MTPGGLRVIYGAFRVAGGLITTVFAVSVVALFADDWIGWTSAGLSSWLRQTARVAFGVSLAMVPPMLAAQWLADRLVQRKIRELRGPHAGSAGCGRCGRVGCVQAKLLERVWH
ncbi:hypothetical protein HII36_49400 [Nonomuraea sp. NN258]|uniref:hypothetical protein n=1 Tax=Nonomuraea antri TaxID=2730852 RepID=UPI0015682D1F|nr:hypothetical protein [Nonomuraea antri]NRQ39794.1 hypothetical protein [Nonomuraea antri]